MNTLQHKNITWIDIEKPDAEDILYLKEKFDLHPLVLEEFTSPSQRPRAEEFENCLYIVIHVPLFDKKTRVTYSGELDIVITPDYLITSHADEHIPLKAVMKTLNGDEKEKDKAMSKTIGFFLYYILEKLMSSCFPKIDHINEKIDFIEKEIFSGHEKEMMREISTIKRDVLNFRRILKPQKSIFESLIQNKYRLLEDELKDYFQDLVGTNIRVWNAMENTKEVTEALEETNNSMISYKLNETMRLLTAVSLITFTLSVTTGIFSMAPFGAFGIHNNPATFWVVLMLMSLIVLILLFIFKRMKWF